MHWVMMQQDTPQDYVIATGEQHSVREFVELAAELGISIEWRGQAEGGKGYDSATGNCIVAVNPKYYRPTEVETLLGDPTKAKRHLGWEPRISFAELVREMVQMDFREAKRDHLCKQHGFEICQPQE